MRYKMDNILAQKFSSELMLLLGEKSEHQDEISAALYEICSGYMEIGFDCGVKASGAYDDLYESVDDVPKPFIDSDRVDTLSKALTDGEDLIERL